MSIKKKVSIKEAIDLAMDNMGVDHTKDIPVFTNWAVWADRKIGSYYSYKKKPIVLDVINCRAELPCEVVAVIGLILGDHGTDCGLIFNNIYSSFGVSKINVDAASGFVVVDANTSTPQCSSTRYEIQDNCIVFEQNLDDSKVTIQALCYQTDDRGFPMVNENHVDAIAQYIEYKNALRTRWRPGQPKQSESAIGHMEKEWGRKLRDARADDGEPSLSEREEIKSMINNPMSGIGISLWRYQDRFYF